MRNLFDELDDDKIHVRFNVRGLEREIEINNTYEMDITWEEILDDVVAALEASFSYSFGLPNLGIYYKGKGNDDSE